MTHASHGAAWGASLLGLTHERAKRADAPRVCRQRRVRGTSQYAARPCSSGRLRWRGRGGRVDRVPWSRTAQGGAQRRVAWAHAHENGCTKARGQSFATRQRTPQQARTRQNRRASGRCASRMCPRASTFGFAVRDASPFALRRPLAESPLRRPRLPNGPRSPVTQGFPMGLEDPLASTVASQWATIASHSRLSNGP